MIEQGFQTAFQSGVSILQKSENGQSVFPNHDLIKYE